MRGAVIIVLSLLLANVLVESWRDVANYMKAIEITWYQLYAVAIYNWLWVKEER